MLSLLKLIWMDLGRQHMLHYIISLNISLIALTYFCESQIILLFIKHIWFLYVVVHATVMQLQKATRRWNLMIYLSNVSSQHLQISSAFWPHEQNEEQSFFVFCKLYSYLFLNFSFPFKQR